MSIYDNMGGAPSVRAAVDDFYARILADRGSRRSSPAPTWSASRPTSAHSSRPRSAVRRSSRAGSTGEP